MKRKFVSSMLGCLLLGIVLVVPGCGSNEKQIYYIWGHSYEFDIDNTWDRFEEFCKMISGHQDIFYGTNAEILLV